MPWDAASYASRYPMAPLGGLFVGTIGVFILFGALAPRARMALTYIGGGVATLALVLGSRLAAGLPPATRAQVGALVFAIVLETIAFVVIIPRARPRGERAVIVATLAIVGTHFLVMLPAFGALIGALGVVCTSNAAIAWKKPAYSIDLAWIIDGALKLGVGLMLVATSPRF